MDIILDEAKKHGMKVWILDDSHFPTGFANGALKDASPELARQFLYYSSVEVLGPMKSAQLDVSKHARHVSNPFSINLFSMGGAKNRRYFDDDKMVSDVAEINPEVQVIKTSLKTGTGFNDVIEAINGFINDN